MYSTKISEFFCLKNREYEQQIVMADNSFRQFTSIRVIGRNRHSIVTTLQLLLSYSYPRANGAKRRSGRKPGARVTNLALPLAKFKVVVHGRWG